MATSYDQEQDRRIAANTAAIKSLLKYIREIRNHFEPIYGLAEKVPEKWAAFVVKLRTLTKLCILAVIIFKAAGWYLKKRHLGIMSERYAEVARQLYYTENNPEVALPFIDKAVDIEKENPEHIYLRAYIKGMSWSVIGSAATSESKSVLTSSETSSSPSCLFPIRRITTRSST